MNIEPQLAGEHARIGDAARNQVVVRITGTGRDVGKTTLAVDLIETLTRRGHRVAAIKQSHHALPADRAGSDSDRLARAGAETTLLASADGILERRRRRGQTLEALCASLAEYDIVVAEGFRDEEFGVELRIDPAHAGSVGIVGPAGCRPMRLRMTNIQRLASVLEGWLAVDREPDRPRRFH